MRFAVTANPCGNWPALQAVLDDMARHGFGPREVICLGDIVGWYAYPCQCVATASRFRATLAGKRDREVCDEIHRRNLQVAAGMIDGEPGAYNSKSGRYFPDRWWITSTAMALTDDQKEALLEFPGETEMLPHRFWAGNDSLSFWEEWRGRIHWFTHSRVDMMQIVRLKMPPPESDAPESPPTVSVTTLSSHPQPDEKAWDCAPVELSLDRDTAIEIGLRGITAAPRAIPSGDKYYEATLNTVSWIALDGRYIARHVIEFPWTESNSYLPVVG